jgi:lysophospholipase L1-like esterase
MFASFVVASIIAFASSTAPCATQGEVPLAKETHLQWKGKKVAIFGDSISDKNVKKWRHWWRYLQDLTGIEPLVYARNGWQWSGVPKQADNLLEEKADPDAIMILMGTNDFNSSVPLGVWWQVIGEEVNRDGDKIICSKRVLDFSKNTVRGRINTAMKLLKSRYPDRQIILLTPLHRGFFACAETNVQPDEAYANTLGLWIDDYVQVVREAGSIWSVPVIDLYAESGLLPSMPEYGRYFNNPETDLLHPGSEGCRRIATVIASRMASMPATFR